MNIFGNKELNKYRILERYRKGLDGCKLIGSTPEYYIYTINASWSTDTIYLLRQEKAHPQKVVFLGRAYPHIAIYQNTIFSINRKSFTNQSKHPLYITDARTGARTEQHLLSQKMSQHQILRNDGILSIHCYSQDVVESITANQNGVVIEVCRRSEKDFEVEESKYRIRIRSNGSTFVTDYDYSEQSASPEKTPDKPKANPPVAPTDESPRKQSGGWAIYGEDIALKPVWRDDNGKITCPGDACPQKKCDDTCPIWLKTMAHGLASIQEYDKAIENYKKALKMAPDFVEAQNNLGTVYGMSGQDQKAYETFLAVHNAMPRYAKALQGLIVAETNLGMTKEALAHCDELDQLPGCDSRQLREKLQPREESNNDSYMKIASELLEMGKEEGFIPQGNSFPHVPELIMMCTDTCQQLIEEIRAYGKTDPNANVSRLSLMWCAYAGMGAVYHWHFNWGELSKYGVFNVLVCERGIEDMDEYVHDCIGKPYSSKEGQQLVSHLRFMADKRLHRLASQKILDFPHFLESAKAMYVYGMVMELHELGMH